LAHGARVKQCAGKTMLSNFARLFKNVDVLLRKRPIGVLLVVFVNELRQPKSARHTGRSTPDDDHIGFQLWTVDLLYGSSEDHFRNDVSSTPFQQKRFGKKRFKKIVMNLLNMTWLLRACAPT